MFLARPYCRPLCRVALGKLSCRSFTATAAAHNAQVKPPFKVLFMGADSFSCAALNALHHAPKGLIDEVVVVTPPARKADRGMKKRSIPPLRLLADKLGYETSTIPESGIKQWTLPSTFSPQEPSSILLTASFGYLIPSTLLNNFLPLNTLNIHPSLLPRYRGASPIQYTIMNGDDEMGVSVQELSKGKFDHGRILGQRKLPTPPNPTFDSVEPILAREGGELLIEVLSNLAQAQQNATTQDNAQASLAPKLSKEMARVDWTGKSAQEILRIQAAIAHQFPIWTTLLPINSSPSQDPLVIQLELAPSPVLSGAPPLPEGKWCPGTLTYDKPTRTLLVTAREESTFLAVRRARSSTRWVEGSEWWNGVGSKKVRTRRLG